VPSSCHPPTKREPDADGMVDTRLALAVDVKVVMDQQVHECIRVKTWSERHPPLESVKCPSVLGGYAMRQRGPREDAIETIEVLSFKCRQRK